VGRVVHRHATIDVFWGAGFLVVYLESLYVAHLARAGTTTSFTNRYVVLAFVAAWGLRLAIYLARRQRGAKEDTRYVFIMKGARGRHETLYALRMIYGLQGLLLWFVSIPLQWIAFHEGVSALFPAGLVLVAIGLFFEATGDEQLRRFIANPANRGTTMNRGLWRYTRHPNYFGDCVVWVGVYLVACSSGWGWLTILSPIAMIYLLTSLSGKPMLERKLAKTRAGYDEYVATTSSFFPRPPRKLT
jgi:steroid 5-alpha reductase family enzyme